MTSPTPLYQELSRKIEQDILARHLADGDFYLTLGEVCDRFRVSLITARKAVSILEGSDLIYCRSARGIFVKDAAALGVLNSSRNIILIFHRHSQENLSVFYELRLGTMVKRFVEAGFGTRIVYDEEIPIDSLRVMGESLQGIVCGERDAEDVAAMPCFASTPILFLNARNPRRDHPGCCQVFYDLEGQKRLSIEYWLRTGRSSIAAVVGDDDPASQGMPAPTEACPFRLSFHRVPARSVEAGRELAEELFRSGDDRSYWVDDDFIALGLCHGFLGHGIDLVRQGRILVNASPVLLMTQDLGLPVIGFSPVEFGRRAAEYFLRNMALPAGADVAPLHVPATGNRNIPQDLR